MALDENWSPPRCGHGRIILACPHDDCKEQNAYVAEQNRKVDAYDSELRKRAREFVRNSLGLPI